MQKKKHQKQLNISMDVSSFKNYVAHSTNADYMYTSHQVRKCWLQNVPA